MNSAHSTNKTPMDKFISESDDTFICKNAVLVGQNRWHTSETLIGCKKQNAEVWIVVLTI